MEVSKIYRDKYDGVLLCQGTRANERFSNDVDNTAERLTIDRRQTGGNLKPGRKGGVPGLLIRSAARSTQARRTFWINYPTNHPLQAIRGLRKTKGRLPPEEKSMGRRGGEIDGTPFVGTALTEVSTRSGITDKPALAAATAKPK